MEDLIVRFSKTIIDEPDDVFRRWHAGVGCTSERQHMITIAFYIANSLAHGFQKLSLFTKCWHLHLAKEIDSFFAHYIIRTRL
jgi:hypothetical protein